MSPARHSRPGCLVGSARSAGDLGSVAIIERSGSKTLVWPPSAFARRLGAVALVALAWRLVYVHLEEPYRVLTDEAWYIGQAQQMFTSHAFTSIFNAVTPTAQHGPLTSVIVAPFAWLFPHALAGLRNVTAVLGTLTVLAVGLTGRELGGERVGLLAAAGAAVLPDFWIRDGLVVSEPVATLLVVLAVWVALRCRSGVTLRRTATLGVLAGLVCLARPEIVLAVAVIALGVIARRGTRHRLAHVGVVVVAAAVVVSPWFAFNQGRFTDTVFLTNNIGITLAGANCPLTYYDTSIMGYDSPRCWDEAQRRASARSSDESVQSAVMRREAESYVVHHLDRVPLVVAMREAWFLGIYRPDWVVHMGTLGGQPAWATWVQAASFWLVFPLVMAGWWLERRRRWPHGIFGVLAASSFLVAAVFVGHWRYRITLDVALVLLAALIVDARWPSRARVAAPEGATAA